MPKLKQITVNSYEKIITGADYNLPAGVLKDQLFVVTAAQEASRIMATGFRYNTGVHELEVYVNGQYKRSVVTIGITEYGDYIEYTNFAVQFEVGVISEDDQVRFRVTSANYQATDAAGEVSQVQQDIVDNSTDISNNASAIALNDNNIDQIGKEVFGDNYSPNGTGSASTRTVGVATNNDSTPDLSDYRTWKTATGGSPVSISNFDNCRADDIKYIIFSNSLTTIISNGNLKLSGGINFNGNQYDTMQIVFDGIRWHEITRSLNS